MKRNDEGITTLEALVAMVIISLACTLVFGTAYVIISSSRKTVTSCKAISAINISDRAMRELVSEVRIPYWERHAPVEISGESIVLPWYRGIRGQTLAVRAGDNSLHMEIQLREGTENIMLLRDMDDISVTPAYTESRVLVGLEVSWKSGTHEFRSLLPVGSFFPEMPE